MTEASGIDEDETRLPFSGEADAILAVENQPFIVSSLVADGETVLMVIRPSLWMVRGIAIPCCRKCAVFPI